MVGEEDRFVTVATLGDDVEPGRLQQATYEPADLLGVVDQDDRGHGATGLIAHPPPVPTCHANMLASWVRSSVGTPSGTVPPG